MQKESKFNKTYLYIGIAVVVLILAFVLFNKSPETPIITETQTPPSEISNGNHEIVMMDGSSKTSPIFEVKGKLKITYHVERTVEKAVFPIYVFEEGQSISYSDSFYADYGFTSTGSLDSKVVPGKYYIKVAPANVKSWNIKIEDYY